MTIRHMAVRHLQAALISALLVLALYLGVQWVRSQSVEASTELVAVPFAKAVYVPCAMDGAGEVVVISGTLDAPTHTIEDGAGGIHIHSNGASSTMVAVGQSSGTIYMGTGRLHISRNWASNGSYQYKYVGNLSLTSAAGDTLQVHIRMHVMVNSQGSVISRTYDLDVRCR